MNASKLIVAGLSLGMIVSLAGCNTYQTRRVEIRETRSASERAAACVAAFEGENGKAPQVMVICPPPIVEVGDLGDIFAEGTAPSRQLSAAFAKMARRLKVPLVDAGEIIAVSPVDGIHYEPEAQVKLGLAMADEVRRHFG